VASCYICWSSLLLFGVLISVYGAPLEFPPGVCRLSGCSAPSYFLPPPSVCMGSGVLVIDATGTFAALCGPSFLLMSWTTFLFLSYPSSWKIRGGDYRDLFALDEAVCVSRLGPMFARTRVPLKNQKGRIASPEFCSCRGGLGGLVEAWFLRMSHACARGVSFLGSAMLVPVCKR